jgi:7,8-dihydropterin-6-yl-methyl-4-(beta-D-ribofuranosyl)aminobenzene 5'-phosphate synthase
MDGKLVHILYDNYGYRSDLPTGWGFSCFIQGMEKILLFDTGDSGARLMHNLEKMGLSPADVDAVILSHHHRDHTGGLEAFLRMNGEVTVYLTNTFTDRFKETVRSYGANVVSVRDPLPICQDVFSTGEMGTFLMEQSLVLKNATGLIVLTGCAHPGIVKIIERTKALFKEEILLVMGGFHLVDMGMGNMQRIVLKFQELGVRYVGPCHCTGVRQIKAFEKAYGKHFLRLGVGKVIRIQDL